MPDDKRLTTTFYIEWLKHIKKDLQAYNDLQTYERFKTYKNCTKKSSKKDASVTDFYIHAISAHSEDLNIQM